MVRETWVQFQTLKVVLDTSLLNNPGKGFFACESFRYTFYCLSG